MCSIFGAIKWSEHSPKNFLEKSLELMRHRGPEGENVEQVQNAYLGHQRLRIVDLDSRANQPFHYHDHTIAFNGEIYDFKRLKAQYFKDEIFHTTSDTEVLIHLLDKFGVKTFNLLNGMFALAWLDKKNKKLTLIRDRFGVKPLYYTFNNGNLLFSSEMKPLLSQVSEISLNTDEVEHFNEDTASDYGEFTVYKNIFQLKPGHLIEFDLEKFSDPAQVRWYKEKDFVIPQYSSYEEFTNILEDLLVDSIELRMIADVPLAITLSGGLDSTVIYTLIKERLKKDIKCFTVSHENALSDEFQTVKKLVAPYGDELIKIVDNKNYTWEKLEAALFALESPTWDNSCITYDNIYKVIKENGITVVIEGHGSDEQLGGYPYMALEAYFTALRNTDFFQAKELRNVYAQTCNTTLGENGQEEKWIWKSFLKPNLRKILKGSSGYESYDFDKCLRQSFDYKILPIVLKTFDRLSMKHAVESRSPFMDYRIVEFLRSAPMRYKINKLGTKAPLRSILTKYKKDFISQNKVKMGFASDSPQFYKNAENVDAIINILKKQNITYTRFNLPENIIQLLQSKNIKWEFVNPLWKVFSVELQKEVISDAI